MVVHLYLVDPIKVVGVSIVRTWVIRQKTENHESFYVRGKQENKDKFFCFGCFICYDPHLVKDHLKRKKLNITIAGSEKKNLDFESFS